MEPRKAKAPPRDEPPPPQPAPRRGEEAISRMPITVPSMRAVVAGARPAASPAPEATASFAPALSPVLVPERTHEPAEPASGALSPGDVLADRYRLIEPLGRGGMGEVWRARCKTIELDVAVKVIRASAALPDARERLLREARFAARVNHPCSVRVLDCAVTSAGDPLLVMELLGGRSLFRTLSENGPLSPVLATQVMLPIIGALTAAHRESIIHRDVKPSNILLVEDGPRITPKLIDFGIACALPSQGMRRLTAKDMAIGSPEYMAPERLRKGGSDPDARTDVWGVCTTLFEIVSGMRPPADPSGASPDDITPGRAMRGAAFAEHPQFWSIVARGLARDPGSRWQSMKALGSVLADWALKAGAQWDVTRTSLSVYGA